MATGGDGWLTESQIDSLASALLPSHIQLRMGLTQEEIEQFRIPNIDTISNEYMEPLAFGFMDINEDMIQHLRHLHKGDHLAFNKAILEIWIHDNPGQNQTQVSLRVYLFLFVS